MMLCPGFDPTKPYFEFHLKKKGRNEIKYKVACLI